jgi:FkbM family methyltransferase
MYFSQCGQDRFLDQEIFRGYRRGVFVEVGAWDGVDLSNTVFFERERGWTGLAIEPLPDRYRQLVANRTCDSLNVAISDVEGDAEFLSISGPTSMLSGLVSTYHPRHVVRIDREAAELGATKTTLRVPTRRLDSIFREKGLTRIHYLSIDVEGAEFECLRSIDFNAVYIDIIGFEDNYPETTAPILDYLNARGYTILKRSPGECFMIRTGSPFSPQKLPKLPLFKLR